MKDYNFNEIQSGRGKKKGIYATLSVCAVFAICCMLMFTPSSTSSIFAIDNIDIAPDNSPETSLFQDMTDAETANLTTTNASEIALSFADLNINETWLEISTSDMMCEPDDYCTAFLRPSEYDEQIPSAIKIYNKARIFATIEEAQSYYDILETGYDENYTISHYEIGDDGFLYETSDYIEISYVKNNVVARMCVHCADLIVADFDLSDLLVYVAIVEARIID